MSIQQHISSYIASSISNHVTGGAGIASAYSVNFGAGLPPSSTFTRASKAWGYDANGDVVEYANNVPRFVCCEIPRAIAGSLVHNGVSGGLMVEEAKTNSILYSNDLTNAAWTKTNMTAIASMPPSANQHTDLTATANGATVTQAVTAATGGVFSVDIRRLTGTGDVSISIDNFSTETVQPVTTDWQRFELRGAGTNPTMGIKLATSGDVVQVRLAQHEAAQFGTSPIYTTATAVTRAIENCYIEPIAWLDAAGGTIVFSSILRESGFSGNVYTVYQLQDKSVSSSTPTIHMGQVFGSDARLRGRTFITGSAQAQTVSGTGAADYTRFKGANVFLQNDFISYLNGVAGAADTSGSVPAGLDRLWIGSFTNSAGAQVAHLNGWIDSITYYDRRLTDAELVALTS